MQDFAVLQDMLLGLHQLAACSAGMVPVFVSVVVFRWQHSCSGFEDSAGLLPGEFVHVSGSFLGFPSC